tara:strand:- start:78 stop:257 length:180 start_codon:yes stop_codon:yes gene_type:complete
MLNIFKRFEEIKLELQRIEIQFQRIEWILCDIQFELGKLKVGVLSKSISQQGEKDDPIL